MTTEIVDLPESCHLDCQSVKGSDAMIFSRCVGDSMFHVSGTKRP